MARKHGNDHTDWLLMFVQANAGHLTDRATFGQFQEVGLLRDGHPDGDLVIQPPLGDAQRVT